MLWICRIIDQRGMALILNTLFLIERTAVLLCFSIVLRSTNLPPPVRTFQANVDWRYPYQ